MYLPRKSSGLHQKETLLLRIVFVLASMLYAFVLEFVYREVVAPRYAYAGLYGTELTWWQHVFSFAVVGITAWFLPIKMLPSSVLSAILFIHLVIPVSFLSFHLRGLTELEAIALPVAIAANMILLAVILRAAKPITFRPIPYGGRIAVFSLLFVGLATIGLRLTMFGDIEFNFDLFDVYERRIAARSIVGTRNISAYLISIGTTGVGLLMIVIGGVKGKHWLWVLGVIIYLLAFLTVGSKAALFMPITLFAGMFMMKYMAKYFLQILMLGLSLICFAAWLEPLTVDSYYVSGVFVRRELSVPSAATVGYYNFFSENPKYYYSDSVLRFFLDSPYGVSKSFLIGSIAGNKHTNANANIWASGFADVGYFGMVIATVVVSFVGRILDGFSYRIGYSIPALAAVALGFQLSQSPVERALVGHGGLALLLFLFLLQSTDSIAATRPQRVKIRPPDIPVNAW